MLRILVCPANIVAITLTLLLGAGCSSSSEQADSFIADANEAIAEHNQLFEEARGTYDAAKETIEAGKGSSGESTSAGGTTSATDNAQEVEQVGRARETMQQARERLQDARTPLAKVQDLDVEQAIIDYTALLSEAVDAQIAAEEQEIAYYELLERDPILSDNREEALSLLSEAGNGYAEAQDAYDRAQEVSPTPTRSSFRRARFLARLGQPFAFPRRSLERSILPRYTD